MRAQWPPQPQLPPQPQPPSWLSPCCWECVDGATVAPQSSQWNLPSSLNCADSFLVSCLLHIGHTDVSCCICTICSSILSTNIIPRISYIYVCRGNPNADSYIYVVLSSRPCCESTAVRSGLEPSCSAILARISSFAEGRTCFCVPPPTAT